MIIDYHSFISAEVTLALSFANISGANIFRLIDQWPFKNQKLKVWRAIQLTLGVLLQRHGQ